MNSRRLVMIALYAALFAVLDFAGNSLGLFSMPEGGSMAVSVVVLVLASYHLGYKDAVWVVGISLLLMFTTGKVYIDYGFGQYALDYIVGFGAYAFSAFIPNIKIERKVYWLPLGAIATSLVRLFASTLSGVVYYGLNVLSSFSYQMTYWLPTTILCVVLTGIILPRIDNIRK